MPAASPAPTPRGETENRYTVLGSIHRGGMGEILLAKLEGPEGFSRKVVLKGLLSRLSEDDVSYQLFMREARLMGCLDHPNIVRVFDLPLLNGKPYLAMEYLRGRNFHQVIQRAAGLGGGVPPRVALTVVAQILRGLHYAHSVTNEDGEPLGIIHRDVSPGNLLISFFGEVKVTDFGIAKIANAPRFTGPRSIRGKARYVAPEQVHGEPATVLSDIYSAGVVLAEALTGEPLWERSSVPETLLAIVNEDRELTLDRILRGRPEIPGLRSALRGALSLDVRDRFPSALEFAEALESIALPLGGPTSQVALGVYVRDLFKDAPDVPANDGFGASGYPVPKFEPRIGPKTDPALHDDDGPPLLDARYDATRRIRPEDPKRPKASRHAVTPVLAKPLPFEPMPPFFDGIPEDIADTKIKGFAPWTPTGRVRASGVPPDAAIVPDPAEPLYEYTFSEIIPALVTDKEDSEDPAPKLGPRDELARTPMRACRSRPDEQRGLLLLLAGIFIGAGLAVAGCLIALSLGA